MCVHSLLVLLLMLLLLLILILLFPSPSSSLLLLLLLFLLLLHQSLVYGTPRKDTAEIREDLRKAELFINNRGSCSQPGTGSAGDSDSMAATSSSSSESAGSFTCFELFR
jgi:hypothetical protein